MAAIVVGVAILVFRAVLEVIYRSRQPHTTATTPWRWRSHATMGLLGVAMIVSGFGAYFFGGLLAIGAAVLGVDSIVRGLRTRA